MGGNAGDANCRHRNGSNGAQLRWRHFDRSFGKPSPRLRGVSSLRSFDMNDYPKPPFPKQQQPMPGTSNQMDPPPDYGEVSYKGSGRLAGRVAVITGGDSGIGRAVALAFAREGADLAIAYLSEHDDARETKRLVEEAGRKALLVPGDIQSADHCRDIVRRAVAEFGRIDILVNNTAHQASFKDIED